MKENCYSYLIDSICNIIFTSKHLAIKPQPKNYFAVWTKNDDQGPGAQYIGKHLLND